MHWGGGFTSRAVCVSQVGSETRTGLATLEHQDLGGITQKLAAVSSNFSGDSLAKSLIFGPVGL